MSLFLAIGHIVETLESKLDKKFYLIKQKFMKENFLKDGMYLV